MLRVVFSILILAPAFVWAAPVQVNVDTQASQIKWHGNKMFSEQGHRGTVNLSKGTLTVDGDKITGGEFTVDMTSIKDEDLKDASMQGKLVGHLNSADFFDTANFKEAKYVITKVTAGKNGEYTFDGNMTIRGTTNPETLKMNVKKEGKIWVATGKTQLDRVKYNVKYSSQSAFPDLIKSGKDKIIKDQIELEFNVKTAAN